MKGILTVCALLAMATANAQNAYDAEKLLGSELNGTARFVGMGGAMGALGGDISVMGTNPAGIGIYRSNDIALSFGFNNTGAKSEFNGTSMKEDRTRASFDQIGFVYSNKIGNNTSLRYVNFGFNYHKSKNFNSLFSAGGVLNDNLSQSLQLGIAMDDYQLSSSEFTDILNADNPYTKYWNQLPVLGIMGVRTGVVDWVNSSDYTGPWGWDGVRNNFFSKETGGINQYDFNVAFNIEDRVYLGATLGVYDVNYNRYTSYTEDLQTYAANGAVQDNGGYTLDNYYSLDGTGVDLKLGVIVRPLEDSPFRLGFAVHTPTWYNLRESYDAVLSSDILAMEGAYRQVLSDFLNPDYLTYDYNLATPWKFNVSAGTTLSGLIAIGAEYEYQNYSSSKLEDTSGYSLGGQSSVDDYLKGVHTFRAGMEARLMPEFSFRVGYNYASAAFSKDAYSALSSYGTRTDFNNTEARNTVTFGLGYRGSLVYADLAYKYDMYKSKFYAFDDIDLHATNVDNSRHQLLLTVGVRF